ncbi:MAG: 4-phosphoerythronate dehydrogenase [Balneolales bacterium]
MITVLADSYIDYLQEYLSTDINCITYHPENGPDKEQLENADALLVRTVTQINEYQINLAPKLQFIGTASAGFDHINRPLLHNRGIQFASAPGCNARSVAEYVSTCILYWSWKNKLELKALSVGIVGVGKTGSEVCVLLERLGLKTQCYDPPRQDQDKGFKSCSLKEVLSCDIITLHVPLTHQDEHATNQWLNEIKIKNSSVQLFINSARGGVAADKALLSAKKTKGIDFILDVWENEPNFDDQVSVASFIKTPHIAGYSRQSKRKATKMVCEALNKHFNLDETSTDIMESTEFIDIDSDSNFDTILSKIHPLFHYDDQFRLLIGLPEDEKIIQFRRLRSEIPLRNEFKYLRVPEKVLTKYPHLGDLGLHP